MVDGVISQDSDCFAYGARRVYRNFSVSTQGAASAQGGAVDVYDIDNVQKTMGKQASSVTVTTKINSKFFNRFWTKQNDCFSFTSWLRLLSRSKWSRKRCSYEITKSV